MKKFEKLALLALFAVTCLYVSINPDSIPPALGGKPNTLSGFTKQWCDRMNGHHRKSTTRGLVCEDIPVNKGRFIIEREHYQFFHMVNNHETGLMTVHVQRMNGPEYMTETNLIGSMTPIGTFIHKGGEYWK